MADLTINDLTSKASPVDTDQLEIDDGLGNSFKTTKAQFLAAMQALVDANTAKVSADGSVTTHNDVTDAGSGAIITSAERTKLSGIESGATGDQTGAEIKALYEAEANTNAFTDSEQSKLSGIETGADVTDTGNVTAAGAVMDSEVDADIKTLSLPANTTISAFGATLVDDASASAARTTLDVDQSGTDNSTPVTLAGAGSYLSLLGQQITQDALTESDITDLQSYLLNINSESIGDLSDVVITAVAQGHILYRNATGWVNLGPGTSGEFLKTQGAGANPVWDSIPGGGDMLSTNNLSDVANAATSRTNLGVDPAGTDNSTDVTLTGAGSYLSIAGQQITQRALVETDITDLGSYITDVISDTTPQLGGDLDLDDNAITEQYMAGVTLAAGDLCYLNSTSDAVKVDASAEATCKGMLVMAAEAISALNTGKFILFGTYTTTGLTAGSEYYASTTAGETTTTAPSATGEIVRVVGYAVSSTKFFFNPDVTWVEI